MGGHSPYIAAQDAILRRDWPAGVPRAAITAAVNAVPGGYHTDNKRAMEHRAHDLGLRRPDGFRAKLAQEAHAKGCHEAKNRKPRPQPPAPVTGAITVTLAALVRHARALGLTEDATLDVVAVNRAARRADRGHRGYRVAPAPYRAVR